jgi:hypothetical protein
MAGRVNVRRWQLEVWSWASVEWERELTCGTHASARGERRRRGWKV